MSKLTLGRFAIALSVFGTLLGAVATPSASAAETLSWSSNVTNLRTQVGQTFSFICPPGGAINTVRGSVIYTDDSSVCSAAVHAGKITTADGGAVTLSILPGQPAYPGSNVNGVSTQDHVNGSGSFIFFDTEGFAQDVENSRAATAERATRPMDIYLRFDPEDNYSHPRYLGQEFTFNCVMDPWVDAYIWGTDVYHGDSSVCLAAIHSGLITAEDGGLITIKIGRGQSSYAGSSRNGVHTDDLANRDFQNDISFTFVR
ncbi:MAG: LCCL domain-containing protein [Cyanobacteria bacterium J06649_4]